MKEKGSTQIIRARGIIIVEGHLLTIKRTKLGQTYWVFPGGGVEPNETAQQTVERECKEELGLEVRVNSLFEKEISGHPQTRGQWELFYLCEITGGILGNVTGPEYQFNTHYVGKYELVWVKLDEIKKIDLRPNSIRDILVEKLSNSNL